MPLTLKCGSHSIDLDITKAQLLQFLYKDAAVGPGQLVSLSEFGAALDDTLSSEQAERFLRPKISRHRYCCCFFYTTEDDSHLDVELMKKTRGGIAKEIYVDFRPDDEINLTKYARKNHADPETLFQNIRKEYKLGEFAAASDGGVRHRPGAAAS